MNEPPLLAMDPSICVFCDSEYGDPLLPVHISKVANLCHLEIGGEEKLINKKICMRCKINVDLIENAMELREVMIGALNMKLSSASESSSHCRNGDWEESNGHTPPGERLDTPTDHPEILSTPITSMSGVSLTAKPPNVPTSIKEEMMPMPLHPVLNHVLNPGLNGGLPTCPAPPLLSCPPGFGFPVLPMNGMFNGKTVTPSPSRTNGRRIQNCHKCKISLKTRPYPDAIKHINRCNGQGIRPGRPSLTPRPDTFPCMRCGRKLATREAHDLHVTKCDGTNNNTRGRKPADNTCMLCDENLVYRHILKKHLRTKHGINAQRLDDSVLAALKTGSGTGCDVKEQVLSRIQQKMLTDAFEHDQENGEEGVHDNQQNLLHNDSQELMADSPLPLPKDESEENTAPPTDRPANQGGRSRRKVKPSKYVPEIFTCEFCTKQFDCHSQYTEHCCFAMAGSGRVPDAGEEGEEPSEAFENGQVVSYTAMDVENGAADEIYD